MMDAGKQVKLACTFHYPIFGGYLTKNKNNFWQISRFKQ
jgi:hypothetical protein